jgi:hypothetical protein
MKIIKLLAAFLGVFALMFNSSSCKKDEECCTWNYAGDEYEYCEDDDDWQAYYDSWEEVKALATLTGGDCD